MQRITAWVVVIAGALAAFGCKKKETAVVEEVPAATAAEGDASTLTEEPVLEQIEQGKATPSSTFHPSKASKTETAAGGFSTSGNFVVQVSVFKSKAQADRLAEKLTAAGFPAYVAEVADPTPDLAGTYHRVRIGKFASYRDARDFGENTMRGQGYEYWVDKKSNDHLAISSSESHSAPAPTQAKTKAKSEPASPSRPAEPYTPTPAPSTPPAEPVGVPEPPAPSEPLPPQDNNWGNPAAEPSPPADDAWGNPLNENSAGKGSVPPPPKDTSGGAVDGW